MHAIHIKMLSVSSWSSILFSLFNAKKLLLAGSNLKGKTIYYYYMHYYRFCWKRKAEHQQQKQSITLIIVITDKTSYIFYDHTTTPYNRMLFNCWWSAVRVSVWKSADSIVHQLMLSLSYECTNTQPTLCCNRTVHVCLLCTWERTKDVNKSKHFLHNHVRKLRRKKF